MRRDGTVKAQQQISSQTGNFTGTLSVGDKFGNSVSVADIDGDSIMDVAIGAIGDDDAGSDSGAVWLLLLNTDGTVKTHQKITG